ncbi:MAG TPA: polysaccharide biosynthesis/export family protein [Holophagaceae bacterium]|nr:polysaccharide biosynthesis/export family protein [Holophagaceae bacterium]
MPSPADFRTSRPSARASRGRRFGAALALALGLTACTAPGMKLNVKPSGNGSTTVIDGMKVSLKPLDGQALRAQAGNRLDVASLAPLLSEKLPPYKIGPQDVLLVTVWDHPEITLPLGQYRQDNASGMLVDEEGMLFFPYVGKFSVNGMTTTQVRDVITSKLSRVLQNPQVDVKVLAYRSQKVYVGGEVKNPAVYNVTDVPFTLAEAVNRAGGFLPTSDDSHLVLTRGSQSWTLDFQQLVGQGNRIGQILLKDGDSLHVPNSQEQPVYALGEFARPGTLPMIHGNLSLAQAISNAGGILGASADARSIYVIRKGAGADEVQVFHLDARNPTGMILADQFALKPRDVVYVDAGTLVRFSRVMSLILPTVSAVTSTALTAAEIHYYIPKKAN